MSDTDTVENNSQQVRLPFPVRRDSRGLPWSSTGSCGACWHREGKRCFNDALGTVPTEQVQKVNEPGTWERRLGHEVTDDHYRLCRERSAYANSRNVMRCAFAGIPVFGNEYNGGLTVAQLEAHAAKKKTEGQANEEEQEPDEEDD